MNTLVSAHTSKSIFLPKQFSLAKYFGLALLGSLVIALFSQVTIPMQPVPVTLQTFAVMMVASFYGWRLGLATVALYLFEGTVGFPVFANFHFGFPVGPTAGYLWGFLPAVALSGFLLERGWAKNFFTAFAATLLGDACILFFGVLALSFFIGFDSAIKFGLLPFVGVEVVKLIALSIVIPRCWRKQVHRST